MTHAARDDHKVPRSDSPCQACGHGESDFAADFGVPPVVCRQLEAHLKSYSEKGQLQAGEACIIVEHCHRCEEHNSISLRHDEQKYKSAYNAIYEEVRAQYPALACY